MEKDNICHAVELYKKASRHADAAKLLTRLAQRSGKQQKHLRAKQFHVLAALEIDKQRRKLLDTKVAPFPHHYRSYPNPWPESER